MQQTRIMMGMPITVEIVDAGAAARDIDLVFDYFEYVDEKFSTFKPTSEISRINAHLLPLEQASDDMQRIFQLAELTRQQTFGFFDIYRAGFADPSGIVKGWAIQQAAGLLRQRGFRNFVVDAGGDIQTSGRNPDGQGWRVGIRNPFNIRQIVKVLSVSGQGVATSGTYIRGQHIYNPRGDGSPLRDVLSLTVVGADVYEADRFATAAFAMGRAGIYFIEEQDGLEGYQIDAGGQATPTTGFEQYVVHDEAPARSVQPLGTPHEG